MADPAELQRARFERRIQRANGPLGRSAMWIPGFVAVCFMGFGLFAVIHGIGEWSAGQARSGEALGLVAMGVVFSAMGFGILRMLAGQRRRLQQVSEQLERNRDQPWLLNEDWASGRIRGAGRAVVAVGWAIALLFSALSLPVARAIPEELAKGNQLILLALAFPLVGLGLLGWAAVLTARFLRHGRADLGLDSMPGVRGGELAATLISARPLPPDATLRLTLRNIRRTTTGSGKNRSTSERTLWEDEIEVPASGTTLRHDGYGLPFRLRIPFDTESASPIESGNCILWRLLAHAELPGADFSAQFEVPVFETPESDPDLTSSVVSRKRSDERAQAGTLPAPSSIEMRPRAEGGIELYFPPARNKGAAFTCTLLAVVFGGGAFLMAPHTPALFPVVFGGVGALIGFGALNMWLGSTRVFVEPQGVTLMKRMLVFSRRRFVPRDRIQGVGIDAGMQSGNTTYWDVRLQLAPKGGEGAQIQGSGPRVAPSIRERREAERVLHRIEDVLDL